MDASREPISRRGFFRVVAWSSAALAAAFAGAWAVPSLRTKMRWSLARLAELPLSPEQRIARHFDYLSFAPGTLESFVADWRARVGPLPRRRALPPEIHTRFLLSTDFFKNDADERRTVAYVAFHDPYGSVCGNPLARFD